MSQEFSPQPSFPVSPFSVPSYSGGPFDPSAPAPSAGGLGSGGQGLGGQGVSPVVPQGANYQRTRQMTVGDLLLENRIIFLEGAIHDGNANYLVMQMLYLQSENRHQDIQFYINSPGGSVSAGMAVYDTMQYLDCPVATYCIGLAASMGAVLLAGGEKGKRYMLPHAKAMIHQPSGQVGGQVSDIEIQAREIIKTREELNNVLAADTGQPVETIAVDTERDRYLSAGEAKEYGLVDHVVEKKKKKKSDA